jgi:hypothetical protein
MATPNNNQKFPFADDTRPEYLRMQNKIHAIQFENNNFDKIAFINSGGGFWQALSHSAYIMQHIVHNQLITLHNQIKFDYNYSLSKNVPFVAYNTEQSGRIKKQLPGYGFTLIRDDDKFFIVKIPNPVDPDTMKVWITEKDVIDSQINALLSVGYTQTKLFTSVREMSTDLIRAIAKFNGQVKPILGDRCIGLIFDLYTAIDQIETKPHPTANIDSAISHLRSLATLLSISFDAEFLDSKHALAVGNSINSLMVELIRAKNKLIRDTQKPDQPPQTKKAVHQKSTQI